MSSNGASQRQGAEAKTRPPVHVAIIMDGNGRWAQKRLLSRILGHEKGSEAVRMAARTCREQGIAFLTLYAFSTENWQRPKAEVDALMRLLRRFLKTELPEMLQNNIRLNVIGRIEKLPMDVRQALDQAISATQGNTALQLNLALSYGGRDEITRAAQALAAEVQAGSLRPEDISEERLSSHLDTRGIPDPDLLIRTGGDMRISNFLLWQLAYSEIFVTPTLWPDFDREQFLKILDEFQTRERRFGRV
ncbi:MAG: isoprenyl transferase [Desulfobacterales bacterium]|nr:isoprenyl transferase [Desulfobacterales bacterium]